MSAQTKVRFVVGGQGRWGAGVDLVTAKANFRRQGGRLRDGYTIVEFHGKTEFVGVNEIGGVLYRGNPPTYLDVTPSR